MQQTQTIAVTWSNVCFNQVGFKGFHVPREKQSAVMPFLHDGTEYTLSHGSVVIAAVISCTNNCNPSVMLTAGDKAYLLTHGTQELLN